MKNNVKIKSKKKCKKFRNTGDQVIVCRRPKSGTDGIELGPT